MEADAVMIFNRDWRDAPCPSCGRTTLRLTDYCAMDDCGLCDYPVATGRTCDGAVIVCRNCGDEWSSLQRLRDAERASLAAKLARWNDAVESLQC